MNMKQFEKELLEKIDILINLNALIVSNPNASQTESILTLNKIGLKPKQIADILNTTQNYVNVTLSTKKRKNHSL